MDNEREQTELTPDAVEYEPVPVSRLLAEMKDTAELQIDLCYSSVLFGSQSVAQEVLALERHVDTVQLQARMSLLLSARRPADAEQLAPVLGVVAATEMVSDAAADIAKIVTEAIGIPAAIQAALPDALETLVRLTVQSDSSIAGQSLGERNLETDTGVRVIAINRGGDWLLDPDHETVIQAGDRVVLRGPTAGIGSVYTEFSGETYEPPELPPGTIDDVDRAVDTIILMKNMSELAVDLAYSSVLFDNESLAREVRELEVEMDALQSRLEAWTLRAAKQLDDPIELRGLMHLARATEVISDAALEISDGVLRGLETHPVIEAAVGESVEILVRTMIESGSQLAGTTLGEQTLSTKTGMRVIAVRRGQGADAEWIVSPTASTRLKAGDVVVAKGTRTGRDRLEALAQG